MNCHRLQSADCKSGSDLVESVYWYVVRVANEGGKAFVGEVMVLR